MRAKLLGVEAFAKALVRHEKRLGDALTKGLRAAATILINEATDTVRIDTGALQASGMWYQENSGWRTEITVGYGFPVAGFYDEWGREKDPAVYAVYHHDGYNPWFEQAVLDTTPQMADAIFKHMEKV